MSKGQARSSAQSCGCCSARRRYGPSSPPTLRTITGASHAISSAPGILQLNSAWIDRHRWYVTLSWLPQYFRDLGVELSSVGFYSVAPYLAMVLFENTWATLMDAQMNAGKLSLLIGRSSRSSRRARGRGRLPASAAL